MFAAALQRLLALRVKASPIYEHARGKRGEVFVIARNCLEYVFFRGLRVLRITAHPSDTNAYKRAITVRLIDFTNFRYTHSSSLAASQSVISIHILI